jgi:hypothetical protein
MPLHLNPCELQVVVAYCLQVESIFILLVALEISLYTVHKQALGQGRHECAHHETIDRTNHIIEPSSTSPAKPSGNFLLLLMIWKMKIQFWGAINCINNPPHADIDGN